MWGYRGSYSDIKLYIIRKKEEEGNEKNNKIFNFKGCKKWQI